MRLVTDRLGAGTTVGLVTNTMDVEPFSFLVIRAMQAESIDSNNKNARNHIIEN